MKMTAISIILGMVATASVHANCPSNLDVDQLVECIAVEGSGSDYQDWQKQHAALGTDLSDETTTTSKEETNRNIRLEKIVGNQQ